MPAKKGGNKQRRGPNQKKAQSLQSIETGATNEFYGEVVSKVGGTTIAVALTDGMTVKARLPQSWRKKKQWVRKGSIISVRKDAPDKETAEGINVFTDEQAGTLRNAGLLKGIKTKKRGVVCDEDVTFDDNGDMQAFDDHEDIHEDLQYFPSGFSDDDEEETVDDEVARITSKYDTDTLGNFIDTKGKIVDIESLTEKIAKQRRGDKKKQGGPKDDIVSDKQITSDSDDDIAFSEGDEEVDNGNGNDNDSDGSFDIDDI